MIQFYFLLYLFILGLSFGLCFKKWIPAKFIIFSSFLWGTIIYSTTFYVVYMTGIAISSSIFILILALLLLPTLVICRRTWQNGLEKKDWLTILFVFINFTLLNLIFIQFNFSLTTYDSYTLINLARGMGFDGFSNNVIQTLLSWGGLISILQSTGIHLGFDYLVSLQFNFTFSLIILFFYICEKLSFDIIQDQKLSKIIALFFTVVMISVPMIIIQFFYIHSNLTTALFFFLAAYCGWMAIKENNSVWFVFFNLSLVGVNLSRTESFIYSLVIISLLLISNKLNFRQRIYAFLPILSAQTIWFVYMYARILNGINVLDPNIDELFNGTKNLNPQKLQLMIFFMLAVIGVILLSRVKFISNKIFPKFDKYFLIFLVIALVGMVIIRPIHMKTSMYFFLANLYYAGQWGFSFWFVSIFLIVLIFNNRLPIEDFLIKNLIGTTIIIIALSFLRNPFRYGWTDSANRLMTFGIPIGFLLIAISTSRWLKSRNISLEHESKFD